jgi:hypothetical protein
LDRVTQLLNRQTGGQAEIFNRHDKFVSSRRISVFKAIAAIRASDFMIFPDGKTNQGIS